MKKFIVGLLSLYLISASALAAPTTAIRPPIFMQKMRPPQATTRFFGEVKFPTPVHNVYFLHFYEFPQTPSIVAGPDVERMSGEQDYKADLFTRRVRGRKVSYHLVSRLKLDRSYFDHDVSAFDEVSASFIWLVPAKRQIPILQLKCTVTQGFYGPFNETVLFVFDKGFGAKPITQGFYSYSNHIDGEYFSFNKVDEQGFRVVTSRYQALGVDRPTLTDLHWNGKGFYAVPTPTPTPVPPQ